jgi:hypothetical protein
VSNPDLESALIALSKFGKPHCGLFDSGWLCNVDMHVTATGASFTVRSEFGHPSPMAAALECTQRVDAIMHGFAADAAKAITHG